MISKNYEVIRDINKIGVDWAFGFLVLNGKSITTNIPLTT